VKLPPSAKNTKEAMSIEVKVKVADQVSAGKAF